MVNKEAIARILTAFLALVETDPDRFDPRDVKMVKEKDWWVQRFIEDNRTEDGSLLALTTAMDWRKLNQVNDLTQDNFKELLEKG